MSINKTIYSYTTLFAGLMILLISIPTIAQSGGPYVIKQSVIAGGGTTEATGGQFSSAGTIGQSVAGERTVNSSSSVHAGFWNPVQIGTTAASVSIGGRVTTSTGQGIRNVQIVATLDDGTTRICLTGSFGYYRFDEITAGQTVIITVSSKRYSFAQPAIVVTPADIVNDADFVAGE